MVLTPSVRLGWGRITLALLITRFVVGSSMVSPVANSNPMLDARRGHPRSWFHVLHSIKATDAIRLAGSEKKRTTLTLRFDSPWGTATRLAEDPAHIWFPQPTPGSNKAPTILTYEYTARNWARKQQSDFGWDWGKSFVTSFPEYVNPRISFETN